MWTTPPYIEGTDEQWNRSKTGVLLCVHNALGLLGARETGWFGLGVALYSEHCNYYIDRFHCIHHWNRKWCKQYCQHHKWLQCRVWECAALIPTPGKGGSCKLCSSPTLKLPNRYWNVSFGDCIHYFYFNVNVPGITTQGTHTVCAHVLSPLILCLIVYLHGAAGCVIVTLAYHYMDSALHAYISLVGIGCWDNTCLLTNLSKHAGRVRSSWRSLGDYI